MPWGHPCKSIQRVYCKKVRICHNYSYLWEDTYYQFNIICDIPQLYKRDCTEKGLLRVQNYKSVQRCNKFQAIINSNAIKSIKRIITRHGENYDISKAILSAPTLNLFDILCIKGLEKKGLDLNKAGGF